MKVFYKTIIVVITGILLQSCSKTYEIQFDKLLLLTFHEEFKCPEYLENCRITIKTKDNLDTIEYISDAIIAAKNSDLPEYQYIEATNEKTIGKLIIPSVKSCNITIYNNENDKILELTYKDKANLPTPTSDTGITNLTTWENSNLKCNVEGDISWDYESYPGCWRFYSGKYKLYGCNQTILKEITTEHCTENENCLLKKTTIEYYPTGNIYHKRLEKHVDNANEECTECTHSVEIIEDSYYNEDGSNMTKFDRLINGHNDYILFETNYTSDGLPIYAVMLPYPQSYESGHIIAFSSPSKRFNRIALQNYFNYNVDGDVLECSNYFGYSFGIPKRSNRNWQFFFDIKEIDGEITLIARVPRNHFYHNFEFRISKEPYNSALYEYLKKQIY